MADFVKCVFFIYFDDDEGPIIVAQCPDQFISPKVFECISHHLIPRSELQSKVLALRLGELYLVGYPIVVPNEKYKRKIIEFNLGMMVERKGYEQFEAAYAALLSKVGKILIDLELEREFIWSQKYDKEIGEIVRSIYGHKNIYFQITEFTTLAAELKPIVRKIENKALCEKKQEIFFQNSEVPVLTKKIGFLFKDIALNKICEYINGVRCVQHISEDSEVHLKIVQKGLKCLYELNLIKIIDIFQFSNQYVLTQEID